MSATEDEKTERLHPIRVERARLKRYHEAFEVRRVKTPDLRLSDWIREALDRQADRDLR